jgi:hypothetical protein
MEVVGMILVVERDEPHTRPNGSSIAGVRSQVLDVAWGLWGQNEDDFGTRLPNAPEPQLLARGPKVPAHGTSGSQLPWGWGDHLISHPDPPLDEDQELPLEPVASPHNVQWSVYFVSKVLHEAKRRYPVA